MEDSTFPRALPDDYESDFDNEDEETTTPVISNDNNEGTAEDDSKANPAYATGVKATSDGVVCQSSIDDVERVDNSALEGATNVIGVSVRSMAEVQPLPATAMVPPDQENSRTRNGVFDILTNLSALAHATIDKLFTKHVDTVPTIIESSVDIEVR